MRLIKKLIELSAALVVGTVAVAVVLVSLFLVVVQDRELASTGFPALVEQQLESIFGRGRVSVEAASVGLGDNGINVEMAFRYHNADDGQEFTFPNVRSTISLKGLAQGELRLRSLEVFGLKVFVVRDTSGKLRLPSLTGEGISLGKDLGKSIDELFISGPLGHLDRIELKNSSIEFEDLESGTKRRLHLPGLRMIKEQGQLDLTSLVRFPADESDESLELDFSMTRTPGAGTLVFSSRLSRPVTTLGNDATGTGRAFLEGFLPISTRLVFHDREPDDSFDTNGGENDPEIDIEQIHDFPFDATASAGSGELDAAGTLSLRMNANAELEAIQVRVPHLTARLGPPGDPGSRLEIPKGGLDLVLFPASRIVEVGRAWVSDEETLLQISGRLDWNSLKPKGKFRVDADRLTIERVEDHWPGGRAARAMSWFEKNVSAGEFRSISGDLTFGESGLDYDIGFGIENAEFSFLPGFSPIRGGVGSGRLSTDALKVGLDSGYVEETANGRADVSGSGFEIATFSDPNPTVNLTVNSTSSVGFLAQILERPEVRLRMPEFIDPDTVSGTARVSGSFRFPMKPQPGMQDFEYSISARLEDVRARALRIPGLRESADLESGELVVRSSNAGISVEGPVSAGGLSGALAWNMKSDSSRPRSNVLTVDLDMSPEHLDRFGAEFLKGNLSGTTRLKIEADFDSPEGSVVTATSSLDGMSLTFPELNWSKPASEEAQLVVVWNLDEQDQLYKLRFSAKGLRFETVLGGSDREGGIRLENFELGRWLTTDVSIHHGPDGLQGIELNGGTLNLREARFGRGTGGEDPVAIAFELDHVLVDDQISLSGVSGRVETGGGASGEFSGMVNGPEPVPVSGKFRSREGGRTIELKAEDAGKLLRQTGYFRSAFGGRMDLEIMTHDNSSTRDMSFRITDVRVRNAPVLAEILNSISVIGLLQQLSGQGLAFDSVTGKVKTQPEAVSISNMSAVGASMSITLAGWFDPKSRHIDFVGVLSPVHVLTGVLDKLVGTVLNTLVGPSRENQTFGFKFMMVGSADNPKVTVNPLSILTPGKFRKIFGSEIPTPPQTGE